MHVAEPWPGYGEMTAPDINDRLATADAGMLAVVRLYESAHRKRVTVTRETDRLLAAPHRRLTARLSGARCASRRAPRARPR